MLKYYYAKWDCYINGVYMDSLIVDTIAEDAPNEIIELNSWHELIQFYNFNKDKLPFCLIVSKNSTIYWSNDKITKKKQYPDLHFTIKITAEPHDPTLKEVFTYGNVDLVIQYIQEHWAKLILQM